MLEELLEKIHKAQQQAEIFADACDEMSERFPYQAKALDIVVHTAFEDPSVQGAFLAVHAQHYMQTAQAEKRIKKLEKRLAKLETK